MMIKLIKDKQNECLFLKQDNEDKTINNFQNNKIVSNIKMKEYSYETIEDEIKLILTCIPAADNKVWYSVMWNLKANYKDCYKVLDDWSKTAISQYEPENNKKKFDSCKSSACKYTKTHLINLAMKYNPGLYLDLDIDKIGEWIRQGSKHTVSASKVAQIVMKNQFVAVPNSKIFDIYYFDGVRWIEDLAHNYLINRLQKDLLKLMKIEKNRLMSEILKKTDKEEESEEEDEDEEEDEKKEVKKKRSPEEAALKSCNGIIFKVGQIDYIVSIIKQIQHMI